jgi:16S rRNA G966 N2-methylase RsmD
MFWAPDGKTFCDNEDHSAGQRSLSVGASHQNRLPDEVAVARSDPVYNAHAYLTKVPVTAIEPFLEAFTSPGEVVLDMYAGSGMTGVAAAMHGRSAELRDISELGRHIGGNYLNLVDAKRYRTVAKDVVAAVRKRLGEVYSVRCQGCGGAAELSRTVWTFIYECQACGSPINYYEAFRATDWTKAKIQCGSCDRPFSTRGSQRIAEEPVLDTVACVCHPKLRDHAHLEPLVRCSLEGLSYPSVDIAEDRQMFQASALKKHGLLTTATFFSERNLAVLAALRDAIDEVTPASFRDKLLFAFTAILSRASKRYQWHPKRPLNAANQNYYIAPVFYEWNVFDLFERKIEAAVRSDRYIRERVAANGHEIGRVDYKIGSADALDLSDESVDYVFTDPPFGSNIFYSDMSLFHEVWLRRFTDPRCEAVVDRSGNGRKRRTAERYEKLIVGSLREADRVLRRGGWLSLVFSNSSGEMWALVQRSILCAGFDLDEVTLLDKGQRSVKGLASGFENIVTADLVLSMQKTAKRVPKEPREPPTGALTALVNEILGLGNATTPSQIYLRLVRHYLRQNWNVADLHIRDVVDLVASAGYDVDAASGRLVEREAQVA